MSIAKKKMPQSGLGMQGLFGHTNETNKQRNEQSHILRQHAP